MKLQRLKDETYLVRQNNRIVGELFNQPLFYSDKSVRTEQKSTWNLLDKSGDIIEFESFSVARTELKAMYPDKPKMKSSIGTITKRAWKIRKDAAKREGVKVTEIVWKECFRIAKLETEKRIEKRNYAVIQYRLLKLDDLKIDNVIQPQLIVSDIKPARRFNMNTKTVFTRPESSLKSTTPLKPTAPQRQQISDAQYNAALWSGTDIDTVLRYWYDNRESFRKDVDKMCKLNQRRPDLLETWIDDDEKEFVVTINDAPSVWMDYTEFMRRFHDKTLLVEFAKNASVDMWTDYYVPATGYLVVARCVK